MNLGLFVGIDDYPFEPLTSCVNDAVAMRDQLVKLGMLTAADCILMTSPAVPGSQERPTREALLNTLLRIYEQQEPLEKLFFYYSGHGLSVRTEREADALRTVIVPVGVKHLANSGGYLIDLDELLGRFKRRGAREQVWIVDACRNLPSGSLNVSTIGWDIPQRGDARDAELRGQAVIYAVAPLAKASASKGQHGHLTEHLLHGLACTGPAAWGAAATFDESKDTWVIDCDSLVDYAARRIAATLGPGDWQREYKLPRVWFGEKPITPLRLAGSIESRPFQLAIVPGEAAAAVEVSLSVRRSTIVAWPPKQCGDPVPVAPERYRLSARLLHPNDAQWLAPVISNPIIDIRDTDTYELTVLPRLLDANGATQPPATIVGSLDLKASQISAPSERRITRGGVGSHPEPGSAATIVNPAPGAGTFVWIDAIDPGASVRMTRLNGQRQQLSSPPGEWIRVEPGLWRVEVLLGDDVTAASEEDFAANTRYKITPSAQITPALAALLRASHQPPLLTTFVSSLQPSEAIGPMQGAILPTLLPLLAVKPFDTEKFVLAGFAASLNIPDIVPGTYAPAAIAVALEGDWTDAQRQHMLMSVDAGGPVMRVWQDPEMRVMLFVQHLPRTSAGIKLSLPDLGVIDIAAPRASGYCATASVTLWPDRKADISFNLFRLPPSADKIVRPGRLARALTIAARLFRAGTTLDQVDYDVFSMISYGSYGDPVLGAIAWLGRWKRFSTGAQPNPDAPPDLQSRQSGVHSFLVNNVPLLPDTRVIAAVHNPQEQANAALDVLLEDPSLEQPALAESVAILARRALATGRLDHWSVSRFQQLEDAVFNVIQTFATS